MRSRYPLGRLLAWRDARSGSPEPKEGVEGRTPWAGIPFGEFAFRWEADFPWDGLVVPWGGEFFALERGWR